jgi:hypothetical protein
MTPEELEKLKTVMAMRQPMPAPEVIPPSAIADSPYLKAAAVEAQAAPQQIEPQGTKQQIVEAIRAGMLGLTAGYTGRGPTYESQQLQNQQLERQRQQDLLAQAKGLRQEGFQQSQLYNQEQNQLLNREAAQAQADRSFGLEQSKYEQAKALANRPQLFSASAGTVFGNRNPQTGEIEVQGAAPVKSTTTERNPGYRDRFDDKTGHTMRDYFAQDDVNTVIGTADLGPGRDPSVVGTGNEPGSYQPVTDQRGNIVGWVNPKTKKRVTPEEMGFAGGEDLFKGPMTIDRQTREAAAQSGLRAVTKFRQEMAKNPNLLTQLAIPGSPGARLAAAARAEMTDVLTRVRTGAALNQNEEVFYANQAPKLLDQLFDDPATVAYKLSIFEDNFKALAPQPKQSGGGGGFSIKPGGAVEALLKGTR